MAHGIKVKNNPSERPATMGHLGYRLQFEGRPNNRTGLPQYPVYRHLRELRLEHK
jgi:hypothetical protein